MRNYLRHSLLTLTLLLLVAACSSETAPPTATAEVPTQMPTAIAALPEPTDTVPPTLIPTLTDTPTVTLTSTPGPSLTPSNTPTRTPIPTDTPTPVPQWNGGLANFTPLAPEGATPTATPPTAVPSAVPTFAVPNSTINVLLLGLDDEAGGSGSQRTDTLIVVSINQELKTASLLSIPRDLYVYIPGWTMNRINTALSYGNRASYPGGGVGLLEDTILYNFGIPIHYYARIDFEGFQTVVDAIGGIEVPVTCELTDWRLKSPDLDPQVEDNWELFTMPPGEHVMDGDTALWYVRSRTNSSADWGRSLRQQQVLHAMLNQGVDVGLVAQVPQLWNAYRDAVETDMDIGRMLQLAAVAPAVRENGVQHLYLASKTQSWTVPSSGAAVQLPIWEGDGMMRDTFRRLFLPPALTRVTRSPITVEIVNASGTAITGTLAAENFSRYGFLPVLSDETVPVQDETTATYFAPNFKSSYDWLFSWVAGIYRGNIALDGETSSAYNYRVVIGRDYDTCLNELYAPQPFLPEE